DLFVDRQRLLGQPGAALLAEQVGGRAARQQIAVQDRLHLILQPRPLAQDPPAARDQPPRRLQSLVRTSYPRQDAGGAPLGHAPPTPCGPPASGSQAATTTPTDPRSQRSPASRRGGHRLTRARSPSRKSGLPILRSSQRPCPGGSQPTRRAAVGQPGAGP